MMEMTMTHKSQTNAVKLTMFLAGVVFLLMMIFGLVFRAAQGGLLELDPTLH